MSHFTVLIIGNDAEKKLEPYDENKEVKPYIQYTVGEVVKDKRNASMQVRTKEYANQPLPKFIEEWYGLKADDHNNALTTYNPESKWDWYSIGGRWDGLLIRKDGTKCNQEFKNNLDWPAMKEFSTYAVITDDGKWHAPGCMGWFGMSSDTEDEHEKWKREFQSKFIEPLNDRTRLTVVDCHI